MAGFFPVFFKGYWASSLDAKQSTFYLGMANSAAAIVIVLLAPMLGALADKSGKKKFLLAAFATLGIFMTASLCYIDQGLWKLAACAYALAAIGFSGANVFYDSLLVSVASAHERDVVSSKGYAYGYLGGGILFAINVWMTQNFALLGLKSAEQAVQLSFLTVSIWWFVFSIPLFLTTQENKSRPSALLASIGESLKQVWQTATHVRQQRNVMLFLISFWCYMDGVHTIIRMALDYGMSLGLNPSSLVLALLVTQFVGFPATYLMGKIAARFGARQGIFISLGVYSAIVLGAHQIQTETHFYLMAIAVGLVQGGLQSLSRALFSRIIPAHQSAEYFGFYNLTGKFSAILGPVLMGTTAVLTGSSRHSILVVLVLFLLGVLTMTLVRDNVSSQPPTP